IGKLLQEARKQVARVINDVLLKTYWEVGKRIIEYEQRGKGRAEYGEELLIKLSKDLTQKYGKGFSRSNLQYMRMLYLKYPKCQTLSGKLSWSHYVELLSVSDDLARSFYEKQCIAENWSVRELKRQINSMLFERIGLSKDKKGVLKLAKTGQTIEKEEDIIKDPYILEFLGIPEQYQYSEKELEQKIIDNLQMFLLELGKGFAFVGRQFRITLNNNHFYVDLVFYHTILKCYVLIDLKIGKITHQDIGQMNLYLNYFTKEVNSENDNPPIGIVLGAEKDNILVEYALGGITNKLFVSRYRLHLPQKEELRKKLKHLLEK
ncbi:MAG: PDDEXK nuclease domain-containing protein, partial [Candidatus Omnitrophica bacterium]|nr:PDDEXK nuclease domain-containing protein [Candidatus Omnitrophota bacterium]